MSDRLNTNITAINNYYNDVLTSGYWETLTAANGGVVSESVLDALEESGEIAIQRNADGNIISIIREVYQSGYSGSGGTASTDNNSIIKIPASAEKVSGGYKLTSGLSSAAYFVSAVVSPAIVAAGVGIMLGQAIDWTLYNLNPDFWDAQNMSSLNPETWGNIADTNSLFNMVFLINPSNGTVQPYASEEAIAYMAAYMAKNKVFDKYYEIQPPEGQELPLDTFHLYASKNYAYAKYTYSSTSYTIIISTATNNNDDVFIINTADAGSGFYPTRYAVSKSSFSILTKKISSSGSVTTITTDSQPVTYSGKSFYACVGFASSFHTDKLSSWIGVSSCKYVSSGSQVQMYTIANGSIQNTALIIGYVILYGVGTLIGGVTGINPEDNTEQPQGLNLLDDDVEATLTQLKTQYTGWIGDQTKEKKLTLPDGQGDVEEIPYYPVALPASTSPTINDPQTYTLPNSPTQTTPYISSDNVPSDTSTTVDKVTGDSPTETDIPTSSTGDASTISTPIGGGGSALFTAYNPTQAQINSLGAYMWTDNFVQQLLKLFNDPMQAIIGLHKVYMTPQTTSAQNIKVGYLNTGVSAAVVSDQYTVMDCGSVSLPEYYGNVFDYSPNTKVSLFLPFIGFVDLDVADIMRSRIGVRYTGDVLSGACLAEVSVYRDNAGGVLYEYAGSMSVTYPLSAGSYMGIVANVAGLAASAVGVALTGGSAAPLIGGAVSTLFNSHTNVQHSGSISGNAGVMGGKTPYLIVSRAVHAMANNYKTQTGDSANYTTTLASCTGFVRVSDMHLDGIEATSGELSEIESILRSGVIV